jgi:hypothetical protein
VVVVTALHGSELRPHDTWHYRRDFDLTVVRTFQDGASVAVVVEQYQFPLHVAADAVLDVDPAVKL